MSYDHGCHLASQFRLDPNDYEVLLIVAGLADYTRFDLAMKSTAWRKFLRGHRHTKERMQASIPVLNNIISETVANRDSWDASDDGKLCKKLKCNVALRSLLVASEDSANNNATVVVAIEPTTAANTKAEENNLRKLEELNNKKCR